MRWKDWDLNLKVRLLGEGVFNILFWMFFPFMSIYFAHSFGKSWAGGLLILSQVFGVMANLVGGYCADRFGRKRMMVIAGVGEALAFFFLPLPTPPGLNLRSCLLSVFPSWEWLVPFIGQQVMRW